MKIDTQSLHPEGGCQEFIGYLGHKNDILKQMIVGCERVRRNLKYIKEKGQQG
jgi:hypothetical protein